MVRATIAEEAREEWAVPARTTSAKSGTPTGQEVSSRKTLSALDFFRFYLVEKESSVLAAWFKHFDRDQNGLVTQREFHEGLQHAKYPINAGGLWKELDPEESGAVTLEEVHPEEATLWNSFRKWCAARFSSARDMLVQLKQAAAASDDQLLGLDAFTVGLRRLGWDLGAEAHIFQALDVYADRHLALRELKWLENELARMRLKEKAKRRSMAESRQKAISKLVRKEVLTKFKAFLKRTFSSIYHAWRQALDLDGSMTLQKAELFKVCRHLNWKGDVRTLWSALDQNNSGFTTLELLDPQCARLLAQFKEWAEQTFGLPVAANMWKALDPRRRGKLTHKQFAMECRQRGFHCRWDLLAGWIDWEERKNIVEQDLQVFDRWRPPAWLTAKPNPQAAEQLKGLMKERFGHFLRAWRVAMDKDNSNSCSWPEFVDAARMLRFNGDVAGAWLALDDDLSGFISLKEIDLESHTVLLDFKRWAVHEFGSVRCAFEILDKDRSGELTFTEFRFAVRSYGYPGDLKTLFHCLDQGGERRLQLKEVSFLDDWEDTEADGDDQDLLAEMTKDLGSSMQMTRELPLSESLLLYETDNPGPGAYNVLPAFGALPWMPTARHSGAFSFTLRRALWAQPAATVGPGSYELPKSCERNKPAWSFGKQTRVVSASDRQETVQSPGPGSYDTNSGPQGPRFSMASRRRVVVHPLQRADRTPKVSAKSRSRFCFL